MGSSSSTVKFASEEVIDPFLANVDVWKTIFEMLSVKDRIRLEMTNKRLGLMMLEKYWKRVTSFDTDCVPMNYYPSVSKMNKKNRQILSAVFVSICVNRIGDGLRSLTIREKFFPMPFWRDNLRSVSEGCPNVETINFVFEHATLDIRFDSFSRLKTITVSPYMINASASAFLRIPTSIEVIRGLKGMTFKNAAQIEGFFANRPSLREVCLGQLFTRDRCKADIFRVIAERCPHLKSITLSSYDYNNNIDYNGVIALESMKELCLPRRVLNEMDIVTICERSPLVEALEFCLLFSSDLHLQSAVLNALGSLTKLAVLSLRTDWAYGSADVSPSLVPEFVRSLARNSGASLRRLYLGNTMPLPRAAIEALANGCPKLRHVEFGVRVGEAEPASIRLLIDSIVAHPSWVPQTREGTLVIKIWLTRGYGHAAGAGLAALMALAKPAANLPPGVRLSIEF